MPTAAFNTFTNTKLVPAINANRAAIIEVKIGASKTLAAGTILGQVTATPGVYDAYANAGAGGLGVPLCVLQYAVTTDASGNITNWSGPFASVPADINVPAYEHGDFLCADIVGAPGLITSAITDGPMGKISQGTATTGIWSF